MKETFDSFDPRFRQQVNHPPRHVIGVGSDGLCGDAAVVCIAGVELVVGVVGVLCR